MWAHFPEQRLVIEPKPLGAPDLMLKKLNIPNLYLVCSSNSFSKASVCRLKDMTASSSSCYEKGEVNPAKCQKVKQDNFLKSMFN